MIIENSKNCCGCMACVNICPKKAIEIKENEKGFLYPHIIKEKCVNCNLCEKVCVISNKPIFQSFEKEIYAVQNKNKEILLNSTSGGVFYELSNLILNNNGYITGAVFDKNFNVVHIVSNSIDDIKKMQGAKYVQSDISAIYLPIEKLLNEDKYVLFTGTPCQVNGLKLYLNTKKINTEKLLLCDIICHSVPSPKIFREYISFIEKKYKSKIDFYSFRHKPIGWRNTNIFIRLKNNKEYSNNPLLYSFVNLFYGHNIVRDSCFQCEFTNIDRISDITIGDFWGIEDICPEMDNNKGTSMVFINSEKGKKYFLKILNNLNYKSIPNNTKFTKQPQLYSPCEIPEYQVEFWEDYNKNGILFILKKYGGYNINLKKIIINKLYNILKREKNV